jgi:hypothetical protein
VSVGDCGGVNRPGGGGGGAPSGVGTSKGNCCCAGVGFSKGNCDGSGVHVLEIGTL